MDKRLTKLKRIKLLTPAEPFFAGIAAVRKENERRATGHLLNERIVYSYLAYRARHKSGASINALARETTLHKQTITKALAHLVDLTHLHEGKWHANEPPEGWFVADDSLSGDHWSDRFRYVTLFIPAKRRIGAGDDRRRFGLNHAAVFSYIVSFTRKTNPTTRLSASLLCNLLGMNRKTVSRILTDLRHLEIISCDEIGIRFDLKDDHLSLFQTHTAKPKQTEPSTGPARPESNKYAFKDDGFDEYRPACEYLMPQGHAETAIAISRRLRLDLPAFEDHLLTAKSISDENVKAGKVRYPNLGKFFVNGLQRLLDEQERIDHEASAQERLKNYLDSPEHRELMVEKEREVRADPMHECHLLTSESLIDRVKFSDDGYQNRLKGERMQKRVLMHCRHYCWKHKAAGDQSSSDRGKALYERVLKQALKSLNGYYQKDVRATTEQLEQAIDSVLIGIDGMDSLFGVDEKAEDDRTCA